MRRVVYSLLLVLLASPALADTCPTGWSSVQASKIIDLGGSLLTSGTIAITGVDAKRNIINFGAPGGGAVMKVIKKGPVSSGAIVGTICVPRSDLSSAYVRYHIVVTDNSASGTHAVVIDANDIPITTDVFSLDAYPFPADAYANPPNIFSSGHVTGDLTVTGTIYAGTIEGATAANATHAITADTATTATTATNATNASHATSADTATSATSATHATSADSATTAATASALATTPTDCGSEAINGINADGSPKSCIAAGGGGGSSVGSEGTLQTAGATPGTFDAATPNKVNAALGQSNGLYVFADSIGQATGATSTGVGNAALQNGYVYQLQQDIGGPFLLGGTSGDQEADVNFKWIYRVASPQGNGIDPLYVHELGTNDAIVYMGDGDKQTSFQRMALGSLAWLGTPRANKIFAQNCTLSGGMAVDTTSTLLAGLGVKATTSGAAASCVINNPKSSGTIYACYLIQDANTGTFTISLDGTAQTDPFNGTTTWNAFGDGGALIRTQNTIASGVACGRFTGIASGNHTVLFTVTSTTGSTAAVWPLWVGAAPASSTLNPYVIAVSPNQQNVSSAGAPYAGTYAGFISSIVANLVADGENAIYSDTSNALLTDPSCGNGVQATMFSNCYADAVHPKNPGHSVMHNAIKASTPSSFLLAVTHWNPKQPAQNYIPTAPMTPYQWFDLNPYNLQGSSTWNPGIKFAGGNGQLFGISYQGNTGLTFLAPSGVTGFSFCPWGGGGFLGSVPPTSASCFMDIVTNGQVRFFGGSSTANGTSISGQNLTTGTSVTLLSQGTLKITGANKNGVYSTTTPTSVANSNSPCFYFIGGTWNATLSQPGFDGPCLQFVPTSPTPGGNSGQGYLVLQPSNSIVNVGLDLRNTLLTNHLGTTADATTLNVTNLNVNSLPVTAPIILTTSSLGGSALAAGACSSTTVTQSGVAGTTRVWMTPGSGGPGAGFYWQAWGSGSNTITARVCASVAGTPTAVTYTLEVHL